MMNSKWSYLVSTLTYQLWLLKMKSFINYFKTFSSCKGGFANKKPKKMYIIGIFSQSFNQSFISAQLRIQRCLKEPVRPTRCPCVLLVSLVQANSSCPRLCPKPILSSAWITQIRLWSVDGLSVYDLLSFALLEHNSSEDLCLIPWLKEDITKAKNKLLKRSTVWSCHMFAVSTVDMWYIDTSLLNQNPTHEIPSL